MSGAPGGRINAGLVSRSVALRLVESGLRLAVAESCTGGLIGHMLTNSPGSSRWFMGGVVAYSNEVKKKLLGVSRATLNECGAVSSETACEMARGVRKRLESDIGLAVTGIAGPGGGTDKKPVGTVFMAIIDENGLVTKRLMLSGSRLAIKKAAALAVLKELSGFLGARG